MADFYGIESEDLCRLGIDRLLEMTRRAGKKGTYHVASSLRYYRPEKKRNARVDCESPRLSVELAGWFDSLRRRSA